MTVKRADILSGWREQLDGGGHLVGVVAGSGMTARYAVMGGCDFIMALSSGKYRSMGCGSMAGFLSYTNSNDMVMEYATKELLKASSNIPVIFGFNATDPTRQMYDYILEIKRMGFAGLNNYPTVGMIDGRFREALEESQYSYEREIEAIRFAHYCELLTVAYVFDAKQAREMALAGADVVCAHFGLTSGGYLGPKKVLTLEKARRTAEEIFEAAEEINPQVIKLVYGGPVKTPIDAQYMYHGSKCQGFIGGSAFERIPVESAILEVTRSFKSNNTMEPSSKLEKILFSDPGNYNYIEFIKEYINENYMSEIHLGELAQVAHLSTAYLSTIFKRDVGCNFQNYLIGIRMRKAKELVLSEKYPLIQIAQLVGYQDYAQFSKMYKKCNGVSPREDLRKRKNAQVN